MSDTQESMEEIYGKLQISSINDKEKFIEILFFNFTISSRAIWSDEESNDQAKVEAFKWMNELYHRIWHIKFELRLKQDDESIKRLFQNIKQYSQESKLLRVHIVPTLKLAFRQLEERKMIAPPKI